MMTLSRARVAMAGVGLALLSQLIVFLAGGKPSLLLLLLAAVIGAAAFRILLGHHRSEKEAKRLNQLDTDIAELKRQAAGETVYSNRGDW